MNISPNSLTKIILPTLIFLYGCMNDSSTDSKDFELKVGDKLPSFSVEMNDGSIVTTDDLRGKVSVIVLFNTSCSDCRAEIPCVQEVYATYSQQPDIQFLCISRAEERKSIEEFWSANSITLPFSPQSDTGIFRLFADYTIPRVYISDRTLTIRAAYNDNPLATAKELDKHIALLLQE